MVISGLGTSLGGNQKGYVIKDSLGHEFLVSNPNGGAYKLGDDGTNGGSAWWGNGTLLEIQDNSGVMYLDVPNDIYIETPGSGGYQVGHFDMQNREVQFGDLDLVGNKTRLALSDPANTVFITGDGTNVINVFNGNYDEQYLRVGTLSGGTVDFGDLSGVNNSSTFTFSDATSRAIFSLNDQFNIRSAASTTRYYFNAGYNSAEPIISFGALSYGNGTVFALNDQNQTIESFTDGTFRVKDTTGNTWLEIDPGVRSAIGDIDAVASQAIVDVDTAGGNVYLYGNLHVDRADQSGGSTGDVTLNTQAGTVNFAAGMTSLVLTNNRIISSSEILVSVSSNDATMKSAHTVKGTGSVTIYADVAPTAQTSVTFLVLN